MNYYLKDARGEVVLIKKRDDIWHVVGVYKNCKSSFDSFDLANTYVKNTWTNYILKVQTSDWEFETYDRRDKTLAERVALTLNAQERTFGSNH